VNGFLLQGIVSAFAHSSSFLDGKSKFPMNTTLPTSERDGSPAKHEIADDGLSRWKHALEHGRIPA
jgi:hypothetical protein